MINLFENLDKYWQRSMLSMQKQSKCIKELAFIKIASYLDIVETVLTIKNEKSCRATNF